MDHELSLFPSEMELPRNRTKAPLSATIDTVQALEHNVQFLKARSHVGHASSEGDRNTRVVSADEATTLPVAAIIVAAMLLAFAGARFLPAASHAPLEQAELPPVPTAPVPTAPVPTAPAPTAPALKIAEPAVAPLAAQRVSPPEAGVPKAQAASTNATSRTNRFKGLLVVNSVPPGATVLINQRPAGITPLRVTDFPAGSHAIWVEREGYERWTAGILVQANKTTHVQPVLLSKPQAANTK